MNSARRRRGDDDLLRKIPIRHGSGDGHLLARQNELARPHQPDQMEPPHVPHPGRVGVGIIDNGEPLGLRGVVTPEVVGRPGREENGLVLAVFCDGRKAK